MQTTESDRGGPLNPTTPPPMAGRAEWLPAPTHEDRARAQAFERDGFCVLPPGDGLSPAEVLELQGAFARQAVGPRRGTPNTKRNRKHKHSNSKFVLKVYQQSSLLKYRIMIYLLPHLLHSAKIWFQKR